MTKWGNTPVPDSETVFWRSGPRRIWLRREGKTILLATDKNDKEGEDELGETTAETPPPPEDAEWSHSLLRKEIESVHISPVMPLKNLVVRSNDPLQLMTGAQVYLFVNIPVWVRVAAGKSAEDVLLTESTVPLTKTWFGDHSGGELCLGLRTPIVLETGPKNIPSHRVLCPVRIKNTSNTRLVFNRLCVHVNHLKIFQGNENLWTNEVHVTFCGDEKPSRITNEPGAPSFEKSSKLLTDSRVPTNRSLLRTSFDNLKILDGWKWSPFSN